jgi:hypothetical protein
VRATRSSPISRKIPEEHHPERPILPQSIENSRGILKGNAHLGASKILDPFRLQEPLGSDGRTFSVEHPRLGDRPFFDQVEDAADRD